MERGELPSHTPLLHDFCSMTAEEAEGMLLLGPRLPLFLLVVATSFSNTDWPWFSQMAKMTRASSPGDGPFDFPMVTPVRGSGYRATVLGGLGKA